MVAVNAAHKCSVTLIYIFVLLSEANYGNCPSTSYFAFAFAFPFAKLNANGKWSLCICSNCRNIKCREAVITRTCAGSDFVVSRLRTLASNYEKTQRDESALS